MPCAIGVSDEVTGEAVKLFVVRKDPALTAEQVSQKATDYFNAMFNRPDANAITIAATYSVSGGSQVVVNGQALLTRPTQGFRQPALRSPYAGFHSRYGTEVRQG